MSNEDDWLEVWKSLSYGDGVELNLKDENRSHGFTMHGWLAGVYMRVNI